MRAGKMRGLLCRSNAATAVCRSHASTAACGPADPRAAATVSPPLLPPRRPSYEVRYARLSGDARRRGATAGGGGGGGKRVQAVTLPMVTKRERAPPPKPKARPRPRPTCSSNAAAVTTASDQSFQVVVMRVSIHCQGCAGKIRKHISKMEGVTSFSIDLESKRVTVMGHVSPAGVLESISKVKKAEFWTF